MNIYIDENGLLWERNNYDSFKQITFAEYTQADDDVKSVMTRLHSAFNGIIQSEADRALLVWNSTDIQNEIGGYFVYEFSTSYSNKLNNPELQEKLNLQEQLALEKLTTNYRR